MFCLCPDRSLSTRLLLLILYGSHRSVAAAPMTVSDKEMEEMVAQASFEQNELSYEIFVSEKSTLHDRRYLLNIEIERSLITFDCFFFYGPVVIGS
ncbi:unnamed protein product [Arabis nemorensis]|uniref:Uncharacterized protein n=1 Tax=Arabis nemorensis TaxID=586526 RepID=A0A565CTB0_9BRAS|nr:unnamed protein product [Arabis nemorensis]